VKQFVSALVLALLSAAPRAEASWAICLDTLTGAAMTARTELEAKRKALADWVDKAGTQGVAFTRWQLAWNRQLTCEPVGDGQMRCVARGRPCRISQTPPAPGSEMLKPGDRAP
jgi:hypothetical protein